MATKTPLKRGATGLEEFATGDSIPVANGGVPTGGTTGQSLKKVSNTDFDLEWGTGGGSGDVATDAIWDAKGDLAVGTGANTAAKLTVGTNGAQLYADSAAATGLRWGKNVITPSQITSDQDNYSPTGWADAQVVRISGDNGFRAITSFASTFSGDKKNIVNAGSYPVYIPCEHPDGTAANRVTGSRDYVLMPNSSVSIEKDGTSDRWRLSFIPEPDGLKAIKYIFVPGSITSGDWGHVAFSQASGTIASVNAASGLPGANAVGTGASSSGASTLSMPKTVNSLAFFGDAHIFVESLVSIPTLSDGTQTFTIQSGFITTTTNNSLAVNNTAGIRYSHGINSGKFEGFSRDNSGTESTADLGITVAVNTLYVLRTEIDKSISEVRFYVNGAFAGRVTGNMPSATTVAGRACIVKTLGATARSMNVHGHRFGAIYP